MRSVSILVLSLLISGCAAVQQQKAQPPRPDDLHFHNLKVFPQNIPREELLAHMRSFNRALGVRCDHCHVESPQTPEEFDFPADAKPNKEAARVMIRMTNDINNNYVAKIEEMYTNVSCWTCHRGATRPDVAPAAPAGR